MKRALILLTLFGALVVRAAVPVYTPPPPIYEKEVEFLRQHTRVVELSDRSGRARVAVVPAYQGRVMTSSAAGLAGLSYGWINRELIASGKVQPHISVYGGEDRFWLGPEGGQFSLFFAKGVAFDLEHWFTPASLDTQPFEVASQGPDRVVCRRQIELTNYSGTRFTVEVTREVRLLDAATALKEQGVQLPAGVRAVAFESVNTIRNAGQNAWTRETGLLSIWILGMLNASPTTTVVLPVKTGDEATLGPVVNDTYFGKVPAERLAVTKGAVYFSADSKFRSKIGLNPRRAKEVFGSYDAANHLLSLVKFTLPAGAEEYVNSMWKLQDKPFSGDVVNSYNDGPPAPGAAQLGKFYELETSSPALALAPGRAASHTHRTIHLQGAERLLDPLAQATLGAGVDRIKSALPARP